MTASSLDAALLPTLPLLVVAQAESPGMLTSWTPMNVILILISCGYVAVMIINAVKGKNPPQSQASAAAITQVTEWLKNHDNQLADLAKGMLPPQVSADLLKTMGTLPNQLGVVANLLGTLDQLSSSGGAAALQKIANAVTKPRPAAQPTTVVVRPEVAVVEQPPQQ